MAHAGIGYSENFRNGLKKGAGLGEMEICDDEDTDVRTTGRNLDKMAPQNI